MFRIEANVVRFFGIKIWTDQVTIMKYEIRFVEASVGELWAMEIEFWCLQYVNSKGPQVDPQFWVN